MVESIEKVLQRGERIELLVDKSEQLESEVFIFDFSSILFQKTFI